MSKYRLFTYNQYGQLVYRKTGRAAPDTYTVRGKTVYGTDGRKIGNVGKGTAKERRTVQKAATAGGRVPVRTKERSSGRFSFTNIRKAREKALKTVGRTELITPPPTKDEIRKFGKSVKNMALLSVEQDPEAYRKIQMLDDSRLMQLYREQEMIFDVYFDYGSVNEEEGKGKRGSKETAKNARALIEAYENRFGPILIQETL